MPANAKHVNTTVNVMTTILGMGSGNIAHVQLPVFQKQVKQGTVVSHRRNVVEMMLRAGVNISQEVVLLFDKSDCLSSDSRTAHQYCIAAYHSGFSPAFQSCRVFEAGHIGSLLLMPVSDFYGYDDNCRPGPAERAETSIGLTFAMVLAILLLNLLWAFLEFVCFGSCRKRILLPKRWLLCCILCILDCQQKSGRASKHIKASLKPTWTDWI